MTNNEKSLMNLFCAMILMTLISCTNDAMMPTDVSNPLVRVEKMGTFISGTRSVCGINEDMPVLQFRDEEAYHSTVKELQIMTQDERALYMEKIGFKAAEQLLTDADKELDLIFDIEDDNLFEISLELFQEKYKNIIVFEGIDEYDVTPYLSFTDSVMNLVGNAKGYIVIGDSLVGPESISPCYESSNVIVDTPLTRSTGPTAILPGFRGFLNSSLTIKSGKYQSTMTIGNIVNGDSLAIQFVTKKKRLFWYKKVSASYCLNLELSSGNYHNYGMVRCPKPSTIVTLGVPLYMLGNSFNATVTNFTSSEVNSIGSGYFSDIRVIWSN